jgi:hypothetical protein
LTGGGFQALPQRSFLNRFTFAGEVPVLFGVHLFHVVRSEAQGNDFRQTLD